MTCTRNFLMSLLTMLVCATASAQQIPELNDVLGLITRVNTQWQQTHPLKTPEEGPFRPYSTNSPFWDNAAYHTGNMEVVKLTHNTQFLDYSLRWAKAARWQGAQGNDRQEWRYSYGERDNFVLFGDWQICFQTYCDLYDMAVSGNDMVLAGINPKQMIARAREVMEYEMSTSANDYWWWADGLYMVMPVMTKLHRITGNPQYLEKLHEYWTYARELMQDPETGFFYRDGKYIYPKHQSANGKKDFWARGDGWVLAALAKVLQDTPQDYAHRQDFLDAYLKLAAAVRDAQQPEGYWTRSILDPDHAPGPETSGTAFFTYGLLWGINNGIISEKDYLPCAMNAWKYLTTTALQADGTIGYVQPIGERAIPGQTVDQKSTSNFGVGAFLLASCEMCRLIERRNPFTAKQKQDRFSYVGDGYSSTSVNTTVFRNSSIATLGEKQYIGYYDAEGYLTIGRRLLGNRQWQVKRTQYKGRVQDAHNVISIMVDGEGYLHVSFDHHGNTLKYCKSVAPDSLMLGALEPMINPVNEKIDRIMLKPGVNMTEGQAKAKARISTRERSTPDENDVTYPEFYRLADGGLLFAYRSGASGRGNLVMNRYDLATRRWSRIQDILIDGENQRNAYWQLFVDAQGTIHVSWVWRETWMVETNHDLCYARSRDGGLTWERSDGTAYKLPITAANAEYACRIPQNSELINQTSMSADAKGHPYIASYWRDADSQVPQYRIVWHDGKSWHQQQVGNRQTAFSLKGGGTKMIPIARPRLAVDGKKAYFIFRDAERESRVSMYSTKDLQKGQWTATDLTTFSVDAWEPSIDTELWKAQQKLHIFIQQSHQGDGEKTVPSPASPVYVYEVMTR